MRVYYLLRKVFFSLLTSLTLLVTSESVKQQDRKLNVEDFQRHHSFAFFQLPRIVCFFQGRMLHLRALWHSVDLEKHPVVLVLFLNVGFKNPHYPQPEDENLN